MNDSNGTPLEGTEFDAKPMPAPFGEAPEKLLGKRIQAARNHYVLSVDALSRLTKTYDETEQRGVSASALLRYEAGDALPAGRELRILCESLGVSADWLIFGRHHSSEVTAREVALLAAMRAAQGEWATRREVGDSLFAHERLAAASLRQQRIEEAKKR